MKTVLIIMLFISCGVMASVLFAQAQEVSVAYVEVPIMNHYDDPARESWEITFKGRTFIDSDSERPITEFRLSSLADHMKNGPTALPVLFVLEIPSKDDLPAFADRIIHLFKEANRVSLPYSTVIRLPNQVQAHAMRTSKLPLDVPMLVMKAGGYFVHDGEILKGFPLRKALLERKDPFHSGDLRLKLEPMCLESHVAWSQLYDLLSVLNRLEQNGIPQFRYSLTLLKNRSETSKEQDPKR